MVILTCIFFSLSKVFSVIVSIINFPTATPYITNQSTHSPGNTSEIMLKVRKETELTHLCGSTLSYRVYVVGFFCVGNVKLSSLCSCNSFSFMELKLKLCSCVIVSRSPGLAHLVSIYSRACGVLWAPRRAPAGFICTK